MKISLLIVVVLVSFKCWGQTFEVDQIEQLFRPRLRTDVKYIFDSRFKDTTASFQHGEANTVFTFPIKTNLSAEFKPDLSRLKLKDILNNSVRIKASQLLGMVRTNVKQASIGFDSVPRKNLVNITAGVLGVRLTKKYRVMFYSLNTSLAEQEKTISSPGVRASALLGQLHIRGLKRNYFYGVAATFSDGTFIPALFFGGSEPIGEKFIFNYTLPVQLNIQYKNDKNILVTAGVSADGYRTGINYAARRVNLNYLSAFSYINLRYKIAKNFVLRAEGGYIFYQNLHYTTIDNYRTNFNIGPGPYVQAGFNILFGQTLWEKVSTGFLNRF